MVPNIGIESNNLHLIDMTALLKNKNKNPSEHVYNLRTDAFIYRFKVVMMKKCLCIPKVYYHNKAFQTDKTMLGIVIRFLYIQV